MNIFVTGVTGFIGNHLLIHLSRSLGPDDRVFVLVRHDRVFADQRIVPVAGDLHSIDRHKDVLLNCEYVFHLAANATFGSTADYDAVNFRPTATIVEILKQSTKLKIFVFLSTIGAIDRAANDPCKTPLTIESAPHPTSRYGQSKLKAEQFIAATGIPFTIIRPTWVYGHGMRSSSHINKFVTMVYKKSPVSHLQFPGKVSLINVEDLAQAMVNVIGNPSVVQKTYFAVTESIALGEIFSIIYNRVRGKKPFQLPVPKLSWIIGKMHSRIPLAVANLFIDYLCARDDAFRKDFRLSSFRSFATTVDDVIETNPHQGYWIVTGANSGIGYELASQLHRMKKKLVLIDRKIDNLTFYHEHLVIAADLTNARERERAAKQIEPLMIYCLINNAGIGARGSIKEIESDMIQRIIDVNVCYPLFFTKLLLGTLVRHESIIVNMASSIAYNPLPHMSIYSASKAFLANWSESLTYELRDTNRVLTVSPAGTFTNFQQTAGVKVLKEGKGLLTAEYVARSIIDTVLNTRRTILFIGVSSRLLLTVTRLLPRTWNIFIWGKLFENMR